MTTLDLLPSEPALEPPKAALPRNGAPRNLADLKTNILIVDDRPDKLLALEAVLSSLGQNLVRAQSGKEALRRLLKQDFAVILLDVSMPGMDGFETAALIRKRLRSEHTPIIFLTSIGNTESQAVRGYSLGAVDYLLSPIVPEVLRSKVAVFVELYRKTELIRRQAEQLRHHEELRHQQEMAAVVDRLETETRRNRFFTLANDLLGIADFSGRFLQVNPSWERVLGIPAEELTHQPIVQFIHPEDRARFWEQLNRLRTEPGSASFEARHQHRDQSYRALHWTVAPFLAENLVYVFARDITARKQAEEQICRLNHELEQRVAALTEANRELEAFNYSIAHDLRAPLRSMSGFAQALAEDAQISTEGLEFARRITSSAKYMDVLLQDLLAYSRLGRAEMVHSLIHPEAPIRELLDVLERDIRERGIQIDIRSPLDSVWAHLPTLKQIVSNLISNALKFVAPDRPPALRLRTTHEGGFIRLWVEDNGIGIAPEHHEKIFGLFQRLHDVQTYPGTGIGLALVRKGAERMGGRAGVESTPGQGSRFWVDLPAPPAGCEEGEA